MSSVKIMRSIIYVLFFLLVGIAGYKARAWDSDIKELQNEYKEIPALRQQIFDESKQLERMENTLNKILREVDGN